MSIEKITTTEYIFYVFDNYDTHQICLIMVNLDGHIFLWDENIENEHVFIDDDSYTVIEGNSISEKESNKTVTLLLEKRDLKIIKSESIESLIEVYRPLHESCHDDDGASCELLYLFKNSLSAHNDKDEWFKYFSDFKNAFFWNGGFMETIAIDMPITIYRGCYTEEISSKNYGISWTYDEEIANCFNSEVVKVETTLDKITLIIGGREKEVIYKHEVNNV